MSAHRTMYLAAIAAALAATSIAFSSAAFAEVVTFKAELKAASEVPPNTTTGAGELTATYDVASKQLSWKGSYSSLSGDPTAAHFHGPAGPGKNADVVIPITELKSPFTGSAGLTDAQAADLDSGLWYVNVHTAANPKGEIRGQVVKVN